MFPLFQELHAEDPLEEAIRQLGDRQFAVRQKAIELLVANKERSIEPLTAALESRHAETRYRAAQALIQLADSDQPAVATAALVALDSGNQSGRIENVLRQRQRIAVKSIQTEGVSLQKSQTVLNLDTASAAHPGLLRQLRWLRDLQVIRFRGRPLSINEMEQLVHLRQLRECAIFDTALSEKHLRVLTQLPKLEILYLTRVGLRSEDLAPLAELGQLSWLDLSGNPLTGKTAGVVEHLSSLTVLDLQDTLIRAATIERIRQSLPGTRILFEEP